MDVSIWDRQQAKVDELKKEAENLNTWAMSPKRDADAIEKMLDGMTFVGGTVNPSLLYKYAQQLREQDDEISE